MRTTSKTFRIALDTLLWSFISFSMMYGIGNHLKDLFRDVSSTKTAIKDLIFEYLKRIPYICNKIKNEKVKLENELDKTLKSKSRSLGQTFAELPETGLDKTEVINLISKQTSENLIWQVGKVSGAVYHGDNSHQAFLNEVFGYYSLANPLHADVWPSVTKFESEIVAMSAALMNGGGKVPFVCGCTTSGGTESIILAIKTHKDYYRDRIFPVSHPEIICCVSAHASVDKACDLMSIRLIKVPMDPITFKCDPRAVARAISRNTILIYASAPSFAQGAIDPVEELAALAKRHGVGLHVDCCLGGFVLPFAAKLGYAIPAFDFTVDGVTSMSLDTHKYGYALKGTSVVLYRTPELRSYQYFCYPRWTGGLYTTPTLAGSRSGGLIAQCWASLVCLGYEGYSANAKLVMDATADYVAAVTAIDGLKVLGAAEAMIVCFGIDPASEVPPSGIYDIADLMTAAGWSLNSLQNPPGLHICITLCHVGKVQGFAQDLRAAVAKVQTDGCAKSSGGTASIYGVTSSLPKGPVKELLRTYNDVLLKL